MPMSTEVAQMVAQAFLRQQETQKPAAQEAAPEDPPLVAPPTSQQEQAKQYAKDFQTQQPQSEAPLASQRQLEDDYNRSEFALEDQLRAQDVQDQGTGGVLAAPPDLSPMHSENPAVITTPEQAAEQSANSAAAAHEDIETNAANERDLAREQAKTQADIARDSQPHIDHLASEIQLRHDHLAKVQAEVEQQQEQSIQNYQQVNTEMMQMAVAQPKDIYSAAHVNSILGRVAVFLGGAGTNGFGPNRNLEYIETLANNNVQQQKMRYEMLSKVGEGQRTLYGMLNAKLSNAYQVDATLKNMGLEVYKANIMAVANKYADQTTKQAANAEVNKVNALQAQNNLGVEQMVQKDAQQNLANFSRMQANEVKAYAAQMKAKTGSSSLVPIAGFVGGVPKAEHPRLAKMIGGSRTLIDGLNEMQKQLASGRLKPTLYDIRSYLVHNSGLLKGARDFLETGTRIEAGEQTVMQAFMVNDPEAYAILVMQTLGLDGDQTDIGRKLEEAKHVVASATYQSVKAVAPKTATLDSKDPIFAHYDPRRRKPVEMEQRYEKVKEATKKYGTEHGRDLINNAPAYTGGY